jgi:hypothetical protein
MTELEIIKNLFKWVDHRKFPWQMCNAFIYAWECDYWAMTAGGEAREFEIKISRSDYFNDAKKEKHNDCNGANYFYYVVPKDLITNAEVDKKYGLIYVWEDGTIDVVKKPRQLHNNKFTDWQMLANKMYWRYRGLWREKYISKEITLEQYHEGFNLSLAEFELNPELCDATK